MKTVLIVILMSLTNPNQPANLVHKTFQSPQACELAYQNAVTNMPKSDTVKVAGFCVPANELVEPTV